MATVRKIFLSAVTAEFGSYRARLRHYLDLPGFTVKVQEDFVPTGTETLDKLDGCIRACDEVIHLVGGMAGAMAQPPSVAVIREHYPDFAGRFPALEPFLTPGGPALPYTQWEAWLALYHRKKLIVVAPVDGAQRDGRHRMDEARQAAQREHLARLASVERYPEVRFANVDELAAEILRSKVTGPAGPATRPANLPYPPSRFFIGRDTLLDELTLHLGPVPGYDAPATALVLHGLGGVGKTRLAVEHAWKHADRHTALLFAGASDLESLHRNLAALCKVLDLPEQEETDANHQRTAVLRWLTGHPGWLLILDNVDSDAAAAAAEALLPHLASGQVLIAARVANWSGGVDVLHVETLTPESSSAFLLARTQGQRRKRLDDAATARTLAIELGGLALALEQAGAYVARRGMTLAGYLAEWQSQRDKMLGWFDPRLMNYPTSVAVTWQASFERLGNAARRLLDQLAWLAPEPIPESLLKVAVPGAEEGGYHDGGDAFEALAELAGYSLVIRAADAESFGMHRLVQEIGRRSQRQHGAMPASLGEALRWVDAAFVGEPQDVRDWPVLDPLLPHARAVVARADAAGSVGPTARLMNQAGMLLFIKAQFPEAEPLMRRALAIDEASFGLEHPKIATDLNNLAALLQDTNRLAEAEPLMRRALAIDETSFGTEHPKVAIRLNNLAQLFQATHRLAEAEPLMRRALAIDEASFGREHPSVAIRLNNLAWLLKATHRLAEAEPLMCRALTINEASFGTEHPSVARVLNNLAVLFQDTHRLAEAEPLMRRVLAIDEASFGTEHPDVAIDLNNLARLLQETHRLAEAEPLMRRALIIFLGCLGAGHPHSQVVSRNYAALLQAKGMAAEAVGEELVTLIGKHSAG